MGERKVKVKSFMVYKTCDVCGADMKFGGVVLAVNPPKYPHECSKDPTHPIVNFDHVYSCVLYEQQE